MMPNNQIVLCSYNYINLCQIATFHYLQSKCPSEKGTGKLSNLLHEWFQLQISISMRLNMMRCIRRAITGNVESCWKPHNRTLFTSQMTKYHSTEIHSMAPEKVFLEVGKCNIGVYFWGLKCVNKINLIYCSQCLEYLP